MIPMYYFLSKKSSVRQLCESIMNCPENWALVMRNTMTVFNNFHNKSMGVTITGCITASDNKIYINENNINDGVKIGEDFVPFSALTGFERIVIADSLRRWVKWNQKEQGRARRRPLDEAWGKLKIGDL